MTLKKLNIKPDPNFKRLEKVLKRKGEPDKVPFFELFSNIEYEVLQVIEPQEPPELNNLKADDEDTENLKNHITYMYSLGYDYISIGPKNFGFPQKEPPSTMTNEGERSYHTASLSTIPDREAFEKYEWPDPEKVDYSIIEKAERVMPDGMKNIVLGPGGVLENVMWLMGYEAISFMLYDDEKLIQEMFEAVASRILRYFDNLASFDSVGAMILGDDMGFKTQTMLSPDILRKYVFPWQKKIVQAIHRHGKSSILHSCGNLKAVMPDIIDCAWEAKHSFEDTIEPVWEAKKHYGDQLALLGGFDMTKISRMSKKEIQKHTEFLIEKCAPGGGWALGTGNSVANYVPVDNLLTMLETGYAFRDY